jgi:hypothetical protein
MGDAARLFCIPRRGAGSVTSITYALSEFLSGGYGTVGRSAPGCPIRRAASTGRIVTPPV